jgi:hypothetical protein
VQADIRVAFAKRRPFGFGFLHSVFTENTMPSFEYRKNVRGFERLRDRNELYILRQTSYLCGGAAHPV